MRGPLNSLITLVFPPLQALMNQIINNNSIEAAQVMKVCLKIFWSSTHYILPIDVPGMDVNFWFHMMASILQKDLPEASSGMEPVGQPIEPEDRAQWPWWKLKKWAFKIMCLFIQRYGNPKVCNEEHVQFAEHFKNNTAKLLLAPVMHMLAQHDKGVFMTDAALRMSLTYVNNCVEMAPTYKLIKPNLDWLLFRVVFKQLCLSDEEMELFNDDPSEFVRKVHDPLEEWTDTRVAAINVLQMLARYRLKDTLPRIMSFISATLIEYAKAPLDPANYRNKDGILVAIGALSSVLRENKTYKVQIEPFMLAHVIPEFTSPVPYLRFRAFWVVEYYDMMKWKSEATFHAILQGCLNGLRDASIPVRTAAATSMKMLFEKPAAHDTIRPILKEIIQEYFNLMEQVDSSTILNVIQSIVMQFGDELYTFAPQMINKIMEQFAEYSAEASADNDADEAAFSACECLETVQHILDVVAEPHPEMLSQIETTLVPIMIGIISNGEQCYEYIESILSIIGFFTYYPDTISPLIWTLCGPLLHALHEWAYDYILEFTTPLLNFISKDVDAFLSLSFEGISHLERLIMICEKALVHDM